jgi:hypothetical protein
VADADNLSKAFKQHPRPRNSHHLPPTSAITTPTFTSIKPTTQNKMFYRFFLVALSLVTFISAGAAIPTSHDTPATAISDLTLPNDSSNSEVLPAVAVNSPRDTNSELGWVTFHMVVKEHCGRNFWGTKFWLNHNVNIQRIFDGNGNSIRDKVADIDAWRPMDDNAVDYNIVGLGTLAMWQIPPPEFVPGYSNIRFSYNGCEWGPWFDTNMTLPDGHLCGQSSPTVIWSHKNNWKCKPKGNHPDRVGQSISFLDHD